ncbi:hypothetical protein C1646_691612 [Rhizophagus diaphanus]|nr:hypothetical protein C1646_691612 [Rhizophagus diaphanus] [Rhizophagus sp. MUCL 43196]
MYICAQKKFQPLSGNIPPAAFNNHTRSHKIKIWGSYYQKKVAKIILAYAWDQLNH